MAISAPSGMLGVDSIIPIPYIGRTVLIGLSLSLQVSFIVVVAAESVELFFSNSD